MELQKKSIEEKSNENVLKNSVIVVIGIWAIGFIAGVLLTVSLSSSVVNNIITLVFW